MAAVKVSVTIDSELLAEARSIAPDGNLSALVSEAVSARVRRARLDALLAADEAEMGPVPEEIVEYVKAHWPA